MRVEYQEFFQKATGYTPYPYQIRMASEKFPEYLCVPTGAGKTAACILAWLYQRKILHKKLPRRLIYCLPMRTLVEQTNKVIKKLLDRLEIKDIDVCVLMGGEDETEWYIEPEKEQIIIGTQDMLLSRAINRGYAVSRFRWPILFGQLNNDCLWVFDEVQLMGNAAATSAQLEAFRRNLGTIHQCKTLWMSATMEKEWLNTIDFGPHLLNGYYLELDNKDRSFPSLEKRLVANKTIYQLAKMRSKELARHIVNEHNPDSLTLVIVNQVKRAIELYNEINKLLPENIEIILIHSHFRPAERKKLQEKLSKSNNAIIVSTQVVEAGIDISAKILYTEVAPWPSLVQRFGRLNRYGEWEDSRAYWLDLDQKEILPYSDEEIIKSREILLSLEAQSIAPNNLPEIKLKLNYSTVIRKSELIDLYDNTADLLGSDIDISRFIRESDELNVSVFWRDFEDRPESNIPAPCRNELCPAPIGDINNLLKAKRPMFVWDPNSERWEYLNFRKLKPGIVILLNAQQGGYDTILGFNVDSKESVNIYDIDGLPSESTRDDRSSTIGWWESLTVHLQKTEVEMMRLNINLDLDDKLQRILLWAAKLHDIGKAHLVFQKTMAKIAKVFGDKIDEKENWAKAPNANVRHAIPHFRHEMASVLFLLQNREILNEIDEESFKLIVYIVACHHGKIRLSIKSLPDEIDRFKKKQIRVARGIEEGSIVRAINIANLAFPETALTLEPMELGRIDGYNWLDLSLRLREQYGPFVLAYLESLLRVADIRASRDRGEDSAS